MPLFKNKYEHVKIYRPNGSPYADGVAVSREPGHMKIGQDARGILVMVAMDEAVANFRREFQRDPEWNLVVMDVVFGDNTVSATIIEIPED